MKFQKHNAVVKRKVRYNRRIILSVASVLCVLVLVTTGFSAAFSAPIIKNQNEKISYTEADDTKERDVTLANTGYEPWYHYIGGVINAANGNLYVAEKDISFKAKGFDLEIIRSYNSHRNLNITGFSYGWTFNYNIQLIEQPDTSIDLIEGDGSVYNFVNLGGGVYQSPPGKHYRLSKVVTDYELRTKNGMLYFFDPTGLLQSISDKNGNQLTFTYSGTLLTSVSDDSGLSLSFSYNINNAIETITDPLGRTIDYQYDTHGDLSQVNDARGNPRYYFYCNETICPELHHLIGVVDENGRVVTFEHVLVGSDSEAIKIGNSVYNYVTESYPNPYTTYTIEYGDHVTNVTRRSVQTQVFYNDEGNPLQLTKPDCGCGEVTYTWDDDMNMLSSSNANGDTFTFEYGSYGNTINIMSPRGFSSSYNWNTIDTGLQYHSRLSDMTDARGYTWYYYYDAEGNLIETEDPTGNFSYNIYNTYGYIEKATDFRGYDTDYVYDTHGYLIEEHDSLGNITYYEYDNVGRLTDYTDSNGYITQYEYDNNDNIVKITDPTGNFTTYEYDNLDSIICIRDANENWKNYTRNFIDKPDTFKDDQGNEEQYEYDRFGNLISVTDELLGVTNYEYDNQGRLTEHIDTNGISSSYTYDSVGNLLTYNDKNGYTTTYEYNQEDMVTRVIDALGNDTFFDYDELGNLVMSMDELGRSTTYSYDEISRLISITDATNNVSYVDHDENGNVISETNVLGYITTYKYDPLNRLITLTDALGNSTDYEYDSVGNRISVIDPKDNTWDYTYDSLNRVIEEINPDDKTTSYSYDPVGNTIGITNNRGYTTSYSYDSLNRLITITDALVNSTLYIYDGKDNLIQKQDANGESILYSYDPLNRLISETDASGMMDLYSYDPVGNLISHTDKNSYTTTYSYDPLNRLIKETDTYGYTESYSYDGVGNRISKTNKNSYTTTYSYDPLNRLISKTDSLGKIESYSYDGMGNLISITNKKGYTSTYSYDPLNRLIAETDALGNSTLSTYDEVGNLITVTNPRGYTTTYSYDGLNRLISTTDNLGNISYAGYDENGNVISDTNYNGYTTTAQYDALDRLKQVTDPAGNITLYSYDPVGNRISETDANGYTIGYTYSNGRLHNITDNLGHVTTYNYDPIGNIIYMEDARNNIYNYYYDARNNLIDIVDPVWQQIIYTYDGVGNIVSRYDANYFTTTFVYDGENQLIEVQYPDGADMIYTYDPNGNLLTSQTLTTGSTYTYDGIDRILSMTQSLSGTTDRLITYSYDSVDNIIGMIDPTSGSTSYSYDGLDRRITTTNPTSDTITYTYDASSRITKEGYSNGDTTTYSYDSVDNLISKITKDAASSTIASYTYSYDPVGNKISETTLSGTSTYAYDSIYRLTNVNYPGGAYCTYTYDPVGNRISEDDNGVVTTWTYDANDRLQTIGGITFWYDNMGNLAQKDIGAETTYYSYDFENRLTAVTLPSSEVLNYQYNGLGNRVARSNSTVSSVFVYDDEDVLMEYTFSGTLINRYTHGPDIDEPLVLRTGGNSYFYHSDGLGSIESISNSVGSVVNTYEYEVFGEPQSTSESVNNNYRFTAREYEPQDSMYYLRARFYEPEIGRFTTPDPLVHIKVYDENIYVYTKNQPVDYIDPFGLKEKPKAEATAKIGTKNNPIREPTPGIISVFTPPDFEFYFYLVIGPIWTEMEEVQTSPKVIGPDENGKCWLQADIVVRQSSYNLHIEINIAIWLKVKISKDDQKKAEEALDTARKTGDASTMVGRVGTGVGFIPVIGDVLGVVASGTADMLATKSSESYEKAVQALKDALNGASAEIDHVEGYWKVWTEDLGEKTIDHGKKGPKSEDSVPCGPVLTGIPSHSTDPGKTEETGSGSTSSPSGSEPTKPGSSTGETPSTPRDPEPEKPGSIDPTPDEKKEEEERSESNKCSDITGCNPTDDLYFLYTIDIGIIESNIENGDYRNVGDDQLTVTIQNLGDETMSTDIDFTLERQELTPTEILSEDFANPSPFPPDGWSTFSRGDSSTWMHDSLWYTATVTSPWPAPMTQNFDEWLVTYSMDFSEVTDTFLSFDHYGDTYPTPGLPIDSKLQIWSTTDGGITPEEFEDTGVLIEQINIISGGGWIYEDIDLTDLDGEEDVHIAFVFTGQEINYNFIEFFMDNILIQGGEFGWNEIPSQTQTNGPYDLDPDVWIESFFDVTYDTEGFYRATFSLDTPLRGLDDDNPYNDIHQAEFTVVTDFNLPVITNVMANPPVQNSGEPVDITCTVTDDTGVDFVWVVIDYPGGGQTNTTMTNIFGTDDFSLNSIYFAPGVYTYNIGARDLVGNTNSDGPHSFTIELNLECGDANGDGVVNVSDAVFIINYVFIPGFPTPEPLCIADANGDDLVNISDAVYLINYIFIPGSPPPVLDCCP